MFTKTTKLAKKDLVEIFHDNIDIIFALLYLVRHL